MKVGVVVGDEKRKSGEWMCGVDLEQKGKGGLKHWHI